MRTMWKRLALRTMSNIKIEPNRSIKGPVAQTITRKINENFPDATHFSIFNDSYKHAGHHGIAEADNKIESHFRLEIVSDKFNGMTLPKRHRLIYELLNEEMNEGSVHALQLTTRTVAEQNRRTNS